VPLTTNEYKLFEQLVSLNQTQLHKLMGDFLKKKYDQVKITKDYIYAVGDIPIALVAHLDTVFKFPVSQMYYDPKKNVAFSPDGLGADDRAGVFAILQILKTDLRPSIIFTTDEEQGGLGASALTFDHPKCPIPNLKYLIELDRHGSMDAVFYDCITADFIDYVEQFGFIEAKGSFSDISFLMSEWNICGVNLSIGYEDEHTYAETLNFNFLFNTVKKVEKMLQEKNIPDFKFEEKPYVFSPSKNANAWKSLDFTFGVKCAKCQLSYEDYEVIPVKGTDGITKFFCPDCINSVSWCSVCAEAYEVTPEGSETICNDCLEDIEWNK
jgi:hypothetical protein